MQQRQLRLGDILDDYCPRERRVTNHAVVAMLGPDVKRQRRKGETPAALYAQVAANAPKRVAHSEVSSQIEAREGDAVVDPEAPVLEEPVAEPSGGVAEVLATVDETTEDTGDEGRDDERDPGLEEGPVHRPLIRASLPRPEGQQPPARPIPEFTIRQPTGRQNRFRPRGPHRGGGQPGNFFQGGGGNRSNGNFAGPSRGPRHGGGRPQQGGGASSHLSRRHGPGRKRSK